MDQEGWELRHIITSMDQKLDSINSRINKLEAKSSFWGGLAGIVTVIAYALYDKFFT